MKIGSTLSRPIAKVHIINIVKPDTHVSLHAYYSSLYLMLY